MNELNFTHLIDAGTLYKENIRRYGRLICDYLATEFGSDEFNDAAYLMNSEIPQVDDDQDLIVFLSKYFPRKYFVRA